MLLSREIFKKSVVRQSQLCFCPAPRRFTKAGRDGCGAIEFGML